MSSGTAEHRRAVVAGGSAPGGFLARWSGALLRIYQRVPLGMLAVWGLLYAPRPFWLGLYHDDWWFLIAPASVTSPFSLSRLKCFVGADTHFASRPLDGALMFVVNSICGVSPFAYQACAALMVLLAAFSLRAWFMALLPDAEFPMKQVAVDLAVMFWLSIAWSVATTAWPVLAPAAMAAQILFTEGSRQLFRGKVGPRRVTVMCLYLTASYLIYEVFYFQFLLVIGFFLVLQRRALRSGIAALGLVVAACISQVAAVGVGRLAALSNSALGRDTAKHLAPNWFGIWLDAFRRLPEHWKIGVSPLGGIWLGAVETALCIGLLLILCNAAQKRSSQAAFRALGILAMGALAIPLAILTFALAGYGLTTGGVMSRTFQGVSWAMAIVVLSLASTLAAPRLRVARLALLGTLLAVICINCVGQRRALSDWAAAWSREREVLAHVPIAKLKPLAVATYKFGDFCGPRVLYIGPAYYHGMVIFGAEWDLTNAVGALPAMLNQGGGRHNVVRIHPAAAEYNWLWDGTDLIQEEPGLWVQRFPTTRLYVWNYARGDVVEVPAGFHISHEQLQGNAE